RAPVGKHGPGQVYRERLVPSYPQRVALNDFFWTGKLPCQLPGADLLVKKPMRQAALAILRARKGRDGCLQCVEGVESAQHHKDERGQAKTSSPLGRSAPCCRRQLGNRQQEQVRKARCRPDYQQQRSDVDNPPTKVVPDDGATNELRAEQSSQQGND